MASEDFKKADTRIVTALFQVEEMQLFKKNPSFFLKIGMDSFLNKIND